METKEFRSLPDFTVIIRVAYNTKENKLSITRYPFSVCKNWGHFYRTAVNRYENHYVCYAYGGNPTIYCTEDKFEIAMKNFRDFLIKNQKKVVDEAKNILYNIENNFNDYKED